MAVISRLRVRSKNLLPFPYLSTEIESNGGKLTVMEDGGILGEGTPTGYVGFVLYDGALIKPPSNKLKLELFGEFENTNAVMFLIDDAGTYVATLVALKNQPVTVDLSEYPTATKLNISYRRNLNDVEMSGTCYLMLTDGEDNVGYQPYLVDITNYNNELLTDIYHKKEIFKGLPLGNYHFAKNTPVSGKNLFDNTAKPFSTANVIVEPYNNGIKVTSKASVSTSSLNAYYSLGDYASNIGKTYNITLSTTNNKDKAIYVGFIKLKGDFEKLTTINSTTIQNGETKTLKAIIPEDTEPDQLIIRLYFYNDNVGAEFILDNIMLEESETATEYEQYSGTQDTRICKNAVEEPIIDLKISGNSEQNGTPTTETPIEIESVGDKSKNLINPLLLGEEYTHNGITYKYLADEDCFLINGTHDVNASASQWVSPYFVMYNEIGTTYTLSATYVSGSVEGEGYFFVGSNDNIGSRQNWVNVKLANSNVSRTRTCEQKYITAFWFYAYSGVVFKDYKVKIQLEKNATATEYEPYGYRVPVRASGKNLFSNKFSDYTKPVNYHIMPIKLEVGKTYCLNASLIGETITGCAVGVAKYGNSYNEFNTDLKICLTTTGETIYHELDITEDYTDPKLVIYCTGEEQFNQIFENYEIQLEEGDTATEYEPYFEPTTTNIYLNEPLRKIGDYADYIDYKNKKVVRNIGEYIFKGNETVGIGTTAISGLIRFYVICDIKAKIAGDMEITVYSSHYKATTPARNWQNEVGISGYSIGDRFCIYDEQRQTIENYSAFATEQYNNGTPIIANYILAEPTEETINIEEISTGKGTNNFVVDTTILPSELKINYWKQI